MSSRLQNFVHVAVKAVVAMSSLSRPSYGESADVATQVADLREPHPTVIVRGLDSHAQAAPSKLRVRGPSGAGDQQATGDARAVRRRLEALRAALIVRKHWERAHV